jgi:hypothetical protein
MDCEFISRKCDIYENKKNSESPDTIPQRLLKDGLDCLLDSLMKLINLIYTLKQLPDQWKVAKTIPIHKRQ